MPLSFSATNSTRFDVRLDTVTHAKAFADDWAALANKSLPSVFLSPGWIKTWMDTHGVGDDRKVWCARLYDSEGLIAAMGLFCETVEVRHKFLKVRQLILHATGDPAKDTITVEYNGLLCTKENERAAWMSLIDYLHNQSHPSWDEIILPGITDELEMQLIPLVANAFRRAEAGSFRIDLAALQREGKNSRDKYLSTLSKNTRSQIRRSIKLYDAQGPLHLERAATLAQAFEWFNDLGTLHDAKWRARGVKTGMRNDDYLRFQHSLIEDRFQAGDIDILRISCGGKPIGFLYNFVWLSVAHFYCSGFIHEEDNRLKPGLVTQVLAVEYYLQRGLKFYDFMGGDDRYKASLGERGPEIITVILQRKRRALQMEDMARRLKRRVGWPNISP